MANEKLKDVLPRVLIDNFDLVTDDMVKKWHIQLLMNLGYLPKN